MSPLNLFISTDLTTDHSATGLGLEGYYNTIASDAAE
jgi:hypothetical protein